MTTIGDDTRLTTLAYTVVREQLTLLRAHEPGTRAGEDPEELHDMRVATRRLREALRTFEPVLPLESEALTSELGWLGTSLAAVRDLDVQLGRLPDLLTLVPANDHVAVGAVRAVLVAEREEQRAALVRVLDSARYQSLLRLGADLLTRPVDAPQTELTVGAAAYALVERPFRRCRKLARRLTPDAPPTEFHAVRKRARRLRYAVEFVAELDPAVTRPFIRRLVQLQDVLGKHQDAEVAIEQLRGLAEHAELTPGALFALGGLAQRHTIEAADLRRQFRPAYRGVVGKRWSRLRKRFQALAAASGQPPLTTKTDPPSDVATSPQT